MNNHKDRLADYIEVPDRIKQFFEKYPEGCLRRLDWRMQEVGDRQFVVYTALAYRTPGDPQPAMGTAWEPFPGKTPYTRDSELMNAETSAWGRALAALGFVGKKIASREEVEARQDVKQEPKQEGNGQITQVEARALLDQASTAGVNGEKLSLWLSSKGVEHDEIHNLGTGVAALKRLDSAQAEELEKWVAGQVKA